MNEFKWSEDREPHFDRRKKMLEEFPQIRSLYGTDYRTAYWALFITILHISIPIFLLPENPWLFILYIVMFGTTFNHIIFLAIHEITHDLVFKSRVLNNWLAMIVNIPLVFPMAMTFKVYHAEHHWQQGKDVVDTDIATRVEAKIFKGFAGKFVWLLFQTMFYAIRPIFTYRIKINKWQIINAIFQASMMTVFYILAGWMGVLYLLLSAIFASGLHPLSGHFISEHFVFREGQETYSYYGPLNRVIFNVGYHNEHHDFPNVPGSKLPQLKKIGEGYYDSLHSYRSWARVIWMFLTDKNVNLFSRVKRHNKLYSDSSNSQGFI